MPTPIELQRILFSLECQSTLWGKIAVLRMAILFKIIILIGLYDRNPNFKIIVLFANSLSNVRSSDMSSKC